MFESETRLRQDVLGLLEALRSLAGGRYAAVFDAKGVVLESPVPGDGGLRRFVESHARDLFGLPAALHEGGEMTDLFSDWESEAFFLAFVNGKVGVVTASTRADGLEPRSAPLLKVLTDRLLRLNPAWRLDERGRGFLASRPRLDTIVIGRAES